MNISECWTMGTSGSKRGNIIYFTKLIGLIERGAGKISGGFGMVHRQVSGSKENPIHEEKTCFITSLNNNANNFAEVVRTH